MTVLGELAALTYRLRDLADKAEALSDDLDRPLARRLELGDLLRRELDVEATGLVARLQLDALIEEITRVVLSDYAEAASELAWGLRDVAGFDKDGERERDDAARCLDCGVDTIAIGEYYMVRDEVWARAADPDGGMLCVGCLEERLGRRLEPRDFLDLPLNHRDFRSARLRSRVIGIEEARAS